MSEIRDQNYYIEKLYGYAGKFQELYREKKYAQAKYLYDTALRVSAFLEVPMAVKEKLFGYRNESSPSIQDSDSDELFPDWMVKRCYEICTIQLYQGYEHESYRRYGQPPQYYPQPRYPTAELSVPNPDGTETAHRLLGLEAAGNSDGSCREERGRAG